MCDRYELKPLILRANAGDWIEVTLHNLFDVNHPVQYFDYPERAAGSKIAYAGERVIFRTLMPADKPRNTGFTIHGNEWREQPKDGYSRVIPLQGAISIGNTFQMDLKDGACCPGDYLYRSGSLKWDVESGMWGIFRVMKQGIGCKCRNVYRKLMSCVGRWQVLFAFPGKECNTGKYEKEKSIDQC